MQMYSILCLVFSMSLPWEAALTWYNHGRIYEKRDWTFFDDTLFVFVVNHHHHYNKSAYLFCFVR